MKNIYSILSPFRLLAIIFFICSIYFFNINVPEGMLALFGILLLGFSVVLILLDLAFKYFFQQLTTVLLIEGVISVILVVMLYFIMK